MANSIKVTWYLFKEFCNCNIHLQCAHWENENKMERASCKPSKCPLVLASVKVEAEKSTSTNKQSMEPLKREGEQCEECGNYYFYCWKVRNGLWLKVVGKKEGYLCIPCFSKKAQVGTLRLMWDGEFDSEDCKECNGDGYTITSCCGDDMKPCLPESDLCPTCHEHTGGEDDKKTCTSCGGIGKKVYGRIPVMVNIPLNVAKNINYGIFMIKIKL